MLRRGQLRRERRHGPCAQRRRRLDRHEPLRLAGQTHQVRRRLVHLCGLDQGDQQPGPVRRRGVGRQPVDLGGRHRRRPASHPGGDRGPDRPLDQPDPVDDRLDPCEVDPARRGQVQGAGEVAGRLVRPTDGVGLLTRADARRQGLGQPPGRQGVAGEVRGGPTLGPSGEGLREGVVQTGPLSGQQVGLDRLAQHRVPEAVAVAVAHEDVVVERGAHGQLEPLGREPADLGQQRVREAAAGDREGPGHEPRVGLELVDPQQQEVRQVAGGVGPADGRHQLLGEERVPLRPVDDVLQLRRRGARPQRPDQRADVVVGQRAELEPTDARQPVPGREQGAQRVTAVQVVAAVGRDQGDRRGEATREQERQEVVGRLVGPVQVLHDDQERLLTRQAGQRGVHGREEQAAVRGLAGVSPRVDQPPDGRVAPGEVGHPVGPFDGQPARELGERQVRDRAATQVQAVPDDDLPAGGLRASGEGGQQAGLADARVAAEQHGTTDRGRDDTRETRELVELVVPPDERCGGGRHGRHHGSRSPTGPGLREGARRAPGPRSELPQARRPDTSDVATVLDERPPESGRKPDVPTRGSRRDSSPRRGSVNGLRTTGGRDGTA